MGDGLRIFVGSVGTLATATLQQAESSATIFAGCCTGLFMLVSAACKVRELRKK